jgi:hypothetical protein
MSILLPRLARRQYTHQLYTLAQLPLRRVPQSTYVQSLLRYWQVPLHIASIAAVDDISHRQFRQFLEQ